MLKIDLISNKIRLKVSWPKTNYQHREDIRKFSNSNWCSSLLSLLVIILAVVLISTPFQILLYDNETNLEKSSSLLCKLSCKGDSSSFTCNIAANNHWVEVVNWLCLTLIYLTVMCSDRKKMTNTIRMRSSNFNYEMFEQCNA